MKFRAYWVARTRLGLRGFPSDLRGLPSPPLPITVKQWVHPPVRFALLQSSTSPARPTPPGAEHLPWGPLPHRGNNRRSPLRDGSVSLAASSRASQARFVPPSTFLTSSTASSSNDLRGFVSPHSHVRGSLFRVFPPDGAARARRSPLPSCRLRLPLLPLVFNHGPKKQPPAFRALLSTGVRCDPRLFRPRPARSPPELHFPRVFLREPLERLHAPSDHGLSRPSSCCRSAT